MRPNLVKEEVHNGEEVYVCECGLGYRDILIAYACEDYFEAHGIKSEDITKRAIYNSRSTERYVRPVSLIP